MLSREELIMENGGFGVSPHLAEKKEGRREKEKRGKGGVKKEIRGRGGGKKRKRRKKGEEGGGEQKEGWRKEEKNTREVGLTSQYDEKENLIY